MELKGRHIVVAGLGRTGTALADFLLRRGARVTATEQADRESLGSRPAELERRGVLTELGGHNPHTFESADLVVLSPGVPHTIRPVERALKNNVPVIGEIELAYLFIKTPVIAVTGTNGKSTVAVLIGRMLEYSGFKVFTGGNLGTPLIEYANMDGTSDFAVVEVSSFQLDTIQEFRPKVAVLLNVTADHLDRYPDFKAYTHSKGRIFMNQEKGDTAVVNQADRASESLMPGISAEILPFNCPRGAEKGAWLEEDEVVLRVPGRGEAVLDCSGIDLAGVHNRENIAAAALASLAAGASFEAVREAVLSFKGLPHRMSRVAQIKGVEFIDDSKATNVDAAARALASFSGPVVLIMGGREKGGGYSELRPLLPGRVRHLVALGEAAGSIRAELGDCAPISLATSMEEAVRAALRAARPGDVVLLSPACASFDMYGSYAERGEDFERHVLTLGDA